MKKLLSVVLAVCLVLSLFTIFFVSISSTKAASEGVFIYDVVGTAPNQTATITGYTGGSGIVVIPNTLGGYPVTSIGYRAFYNCSFITSVTIPNSVTSIGIYAFAGCSSLTSITIPNSVTSIGQEAFSSCSSMTSITIGNGVINIGNAAFSNCSSLTSVSIPDSVTSIPERAFIFCSSLSSVTIGNSVTSIGSAAFGWCSSLTSVIIGSGVTKIDYEAFITCLSLTSMIIPSNVTFIGTWAFYDCPKLIAVYFLGNAPIGTNNMFASDGLYCRTSNLTLYYVNGTTGWSNPWYGYSTATFVPGNHTVTVTVSPFASGTITKSPNTASYAVGTMVTLTAVPAAGYTFSSWTGANPVAGHPEQATIIVDADKTISAIFNKIQEKKQTVIVLQIGKKTFTVNGTAQYLDSPPVIKNGRTLVPIRAIIEALGGTVNWDTTTRKTTVVLGNKTIALWIGKSAATVNGVNTPIDSANTSVVPEIISGRTMLPLRFVTESLGATLDWNPNTQTITITYID